jgi:cytochrome c oxidase assembly protein subunit 11
MNAPRDPRSANLRLVRRLAVVALGAFAFAFALVPLYRVACEQLLGIKLTGDAASAAELASWQVDTSRTVTLTFDGNVADGLAWRFAPDVRSMQVHPGQLYETTFSASNEGPVDLVGQAVPSIAPSTSSIYFSKTECFCFTEQLLRGGESRAMPVRFAIDPALPASVRTLTLSYTFYLNEVATRRVAASQAPATPAAG